MGAESLPVLSYACWDQIVFETLKAIIQPGGSMRDQESIEACDKLGIAMVFTGARHFKH